MYSAVCKGDPVRLPEVGSTLIAVINLATVHCHSVAAVCLDAERSATVHPAGVDLHCRAVLESKHPA